ncbi:ABC-three component system middle component 2 [Curtanaerobium respiraculi]|uniref:ABC-three component system middle component 2 n=1 Tax=Curtanaerobium respiraculi TaxID=2949669 RepID=UPI0024B3A726|nr:ABC-three component system middle component 2 [Curtanaerobium respiraculi]
MKNDVFNSVFENMLRVLLLSEVLGKPANSDRIAALDFISIFGKKFEVLGSNLHGDNDFGFSEYTDKRNKVSEALKLAVKNGFIEATNTGDGFAYAITSRGKQVVDASRSPYSTAYASGASVVCERFESTSDDKLLKFITGKAVESKGV